MALILSNYKSQGMPVPGAYLRIVSVNVVRAGAFMNDTDKAVVSYQIYYDLAARKLNNFLMPGQITLQNDGKTTLFGDIFGAAPAQAETALSTLNFLITRGYKALAQHPDTSSLVTGATRV